MLTQVDYAELAMTLMEGIIYLMVDVAAAISKSDEYETTWRGQKEAKNNNM